MLPNNSNTIPEDLSPYIERMQAKYDALQRSVVEARTQVNRSPSNVQIILASKYFLPWQLKVAYQVGLRQFGENRLQDALSKQKTWRQLYSPDTTPAPTWHFIGHLQQNKINAALGKFSLIQGVDSLSLAQGISNRHERWLGTNSTQQNTPQQQSVLLQVNILGEASKSGFTPEALTHNIHQISQCQGLKIEGLMTMAPLGASPEVLAQVFGQTEALRDRLRNESGLSLTQLSMGMSKDYMHALKYDVTMLRIGRYFVDGVFKSY